MSVVQELCNKTMADARAEVKATQDYIAGGDVSWDATCYWLLVSCVCSVLLQLFALGKIGKL